jgi:surfeit locus 1 family protein
MLARRLAVTLHHVKQRSAQAAQNGQKCDRNKVCHEEDYRMNWARLPKSRHTQSKSLRFVGILLIALLAVALTSSLGFWQLRRAATKEAWQAQMVQRSEMAVVDGASLGQADDSPDNRAGLIHRTVRLQGQWLADQTVFLDNRQMNARVGFYVLTPLRLTASKAVIWVQRGWVPRHFTERSRLPDVPTPTGDVAITGRIALAPSKLYAPGAPGEGPIRQNLDLDQFRSQTGLPLESFTVRESGPPSQGLRRQWSVINFGIEKHYGYAFQWFALSVLIAGLYLWFQFFRRPAATSRDIANHGPH